MKYADIEKREGLILVRINAIDPTEAQFDEYIASTLEAVKEIKNGVLLHNISKGKFLTSEQRIKIGSLYREYGDVFRANLAGMAFVNNAFIPMTILKGVFLVNKPPVAYCVVSSEDEALAWANEATSKNNVK